MSRASDVQSFAIRADVAGDSFTAEAMTASVPHPDHASGHAISLPIRCALVLPDAHATAHAGARLASALRGGMVVTLAGDLGAGKTTLVRGALRALGWTGPVKSPTYTLVEHYSLSSLYFYHFDFYRLHDPEEWSTAGFEEYFRADAVCVAEWPERAGDRLPMADLEIALEYPAAGPEAGRIMTLIARTEAGAGCVRALVPG
jgi:tRNA threonylcarbamoyladenosine biosynthesis protein TsaE